MAWLNDIVPSKTLLPADIEKFGPVETAMRKIDEYLRAWVALQPLATRKYCITWQDKGTVEQDIIEAMKVLGMSVMIIYRGGSPKSALKNAALMSPSKFEISVLERPKVNRAPTGTGMSCNRVAAEIVKCLVGMSLAEGSLALDSWTAPDIKIGQQNILAFHTSLLVSDPTADA